MYHHFHTFHTKMKPIQIGPNCVCACAWTFILSTFEFTLCRRLFSYYFIIIHGLWVLALYSPFVMSSVASNCRENAIYVLFANNHIYLRRKHRTYVFRGWMLTADFSEFNMFICIFRSGFFLIHLMCIFLQRIVCYDSPLFFPTNLFIRFYWSRAPPLFTRKWTCRRSCTVTNQNVPHLSIHWQRQK